MEAWFKGSSWYDTTDLHRTNYRYKDSVTYEKYEFGFRLWGVFNVFV